MNKHQDQPQENLKESITIDAGLGPFQSKKVNLEIRPFTVFIGPQGTGKSLVSQLLYFFRDAQSLIAEYGRSTDVESAVRNVVDKLRAGNLSRPWLPYIAKPTINAYYKGEAERTLTFYAPKRGYRIYVRTRSPFYGEIKELLEKLTLDPTASAEIAPNCIFVPDNRSILSRIETSAIVSPGSAPSIPTLRFLRTMNRAGETQSEWSASLHAKKIGLLAKEDLGGESKYSRAKRGFGHWEWLFVDSSGNAKPIQMEMASSGQTEASPLVVIAQWLLGNDSNHRPQFLHIEEPETHLHPAAQVAMVNILAYLVNNGIKVLVTTHSLTVLYTLNNLLVASSLENHREFGLPEPDVRLARGSVGAYFFPAGDTVKSIVDEETGLISEEQLAQRDEELNTQLSRLEYLRAYGDQEGPDVPLS